MQVFHIRYRNAQGALMRILNAVSRRGLDLTSIHAEYAGQDHAVSVLLDVTQKQTGQLFREWYAIVDVIEVTASPGMRKHEEVLWTGRAQASAAVTEHPARAALA